MKNEESSPSSRPIIGYPLGVALLLILLFCISAFLIGCVNWHKLQALILRYSSDHDRNDNTRSGIDHSPDVRPAFLVKAGQSLPVLMPGDELPRFLAMACPCEPATIEKIKITVPKPPLLPVSIGSLLVE
ncbi:hypothetical protein V6N13_011944 [Hibiscus sabdariffa]|uniref:Hydroxyproline-rich glycoprotein family protein n=1 Tax=Hibiscus sabdariffa TaxID=183260 RepID=A0ABR2SDP9_9ROSI